MCIQAQAEPSVQAVFAQSSRLIQRPTHRVASAWGARAKAGGAALGAVARHVAGLAALCHVIDGSGGWGRAW